MFLISSSINVALQRATSILNFTDIWRVKMILMNLMKLIDASWWVENLIYFIHMYVDRSRDRNFLLLSLLRRIFLVSDSGFDFVAYVYFDGIEFCVGFGCCGEGLGIFLAWWKFLWVRKDFVIIVYHFRSQFD